MPHNFLRGDIVRYIGKPENSVVEQVAPEGSMYMLKDSAINWVPEDQLELVKRASDDETGLKLWYIT